MRDVHVALDIWARSERGAFYKFRICMKFSLSEHIFKFFILYYCKSNINKSILLIYYIRVARRDFIYFIAKCSVGSTEPIKYINPWEPYFYTVKFINLALQITILLNVV